MKSGLTQVFGVLLYSLPKTRTYAKTRSQFVRLFWREEFVAEWQNHTGKVSITQHEKKNTNLYSGVRSPDQKRRTKQKQNRNKTKKTFEPIVKNIKFK